MTSPLIVTRQYCHFRSTQTPSQKILRTQRLRNVLARLNVHDVLAQASTMSVDSPLRSAWRARLDVELLGTTEGTRLGYRRHDGPLRIQRPFYPEGAEVMHLYVLHPPGGVVGGDSLEVCIQARPRSRTLITTPAAQKLYRSSGATSHIRTSLHVEAGASLEWLPSESIAFSGALVDNHWSVRLAAGATFIGWEAICLGRPASDCPFDLGQLHLSTEVHVGDSLELSESQRFEGGSDALHSDWGLGDRVCLATMLCAGDSASGMATLHTRLREAFVDENEAITGVTRLQGLIAVRIQSLSAQSVTRLLRRAWTIARPHLLGHNAHEPRIWAT